MHPTLLHHCNCTYNTPVAYSSSVFSQNITCSHCGSVARGINVLAKAKEEANMQQDELAKLFSVNMTLSRDSPQQFLGQVPQEESAPLHQQHQQTPKQIVYASQHYTHSHHVAPSRSGPEPVAKTQMGTADLVAVLLRNSIDPSSLFPSQVNLFQNADDDQRLRLLELWRISPPHGRQGYPPGLDYEVSRQLCDWPPTSLAQEEVMARLRYEKNQQEFAQQEYIRQHEQQLEASMNAASASSGTQTAEPYMTSGYEMMAQREYEESARTAEKPLQETNKYNQTTDPVFNNIGSTGLWQKNVGSMLEMENNYGAFAYARENNFQPIYGDEEMVM